MIGQTISHYRITGKLGEGGMGVVYRAEDTKLKRDVALKFLAPELTRDPVAKTRFVREAQAAAGLHHPNICTVYEIDEAAGHTFIAMACIEGSTLSQEIRSGPLPLADALDRAIQVAEGLREAHGRGIVHRDIKSANIMLTSTGQVLITDFGLALSPERTKLTLANTAMGTCAYMSPEQSQGGEVDHRSDIWSLGVVLYEMICGRRPFCGEHAQAVLHAMLNEEPDPLTGLRTGVPLELERIVGKALAKDPAARYQHMDDLLVDLQAVRRDLQGGTVATEAPTATLGGTVPAAPAKRRPGTLIAGIVAAVVVVAALLVGLNVGGLRDRISGPGGPEPIRSLAVLPFDNMMGDQEQDFFVEGLHESLITELSKIGSLRVISRTSAMHFRGTSMPLPEIARQLDVDALVEGSVLRVGDRVRITAQLIRGSNDEHIWAEDYDRDLKDVLNLLSEMAGMIAGEIDVALTPGEQEQLAAERMVDPAVYELVLRGLHHLNRFDYEDALVARSYFEQAIAADPEYATAYAFLSGSYVLLSVLGDFPSGEVFPPARAAALEALRLDPDHGGAHTALGFVKLYFDWDWPGAAREFERALELNPNDAYAMHGQADLLTVHGRLDEAVDVVKRARQLDPLSYIRNLTVMGHLLMARRYEETIAEVEQWREFSGNPRAAWYNALHSYSHLGQHDKAMAELRHSSTGRDPEYGPIMESAYAESGLRGAFLVCAERLAAMAQEQYLDPLGIAMYYARVGDAEQTFAWLEKGYEDRISGVHTIAQPDLDPYRDDPRFKDLMRRIGIPEGAWEQLGRGEH